MIGNRFKSDIIAQEYQRILKERAKIIKESQLIVSPAEDDPIEKSLNHEPEYSDLLPDPESFLMESEPDSDDISGALDRNIESMTSMADSCPSCGMQSCNCNREGMSDGSEFFSSTAEHVLHGLGKIAGSLRGKGHGFASDIVEATAISIKDDFIKEAAAKASVVSELKKMASDLSESGNTIASDMVLITIDKIKKS